MADLRQYFPMIRTQEEVRAEIFGTPELSAQFQQWSPEQRQRFLDCCTGQRGVKILYDPFFKEILDPHLFPERVEDLLSLLLGCQVRILEVLPLESPRLGDERSLVIMDLVVRLEDLSVVNLEVQRIGYHFPGQRAACYSADLLLRQYRRIRSQKHKRFSYRDMQKVFTVILFEQSPAEFHGFPEHYCHAFAQRSDTGIQINLLQEYRFVPLDIFQEILHNKGIRNRLEAWLAFLCADDPSVIEKVITAYPQFRPYYEELYELCRNTERMMEMFSKELQELDQNTVQYMIDEMQDEIDRQREQLEEKDGQLKEKDGQLKEKDGQLEEKDGQLKEKDAEIQRLKALLERQAPQ